jgi:tetratricopeptide (TPR) repeat protein
VLAQHYESAGQLSTAFTYWWKAGQYASKLSSLNEAYSAFRRAEQLLQKTNYMVSEGQIHDCYVDWGEVAVTMSDITSAQACFATLQKVGEQEKSPLLVGSALSGLANCMILTNQPGTAIKLLERAIPLLEQSGNIAEQIYGYHRLCRALVWVNRYAETPPYFQRVTELCSQAVMPRALQAKITVYNFLSLIYSLQGWPARAHDLSTQALQTSRRILNDYGIMESSAMLALADFFQGDYSDALEMCGEGLRLIESTNNWRQACLMHLIIARISLFRGEMDSTWSHVSQALTFANQHQIFEYITEGQSVLGDIYSIFQDFPHAIVAYQKGIGSGKENYQTLNIASRLAVALISCGDTQQGMTLLEQVMGMAKPAELGTLYLTVNYFLALMDARQGKTEAALQQCDLLAEEYGRRGIKFQKDLLWIKTQVALIREDLPEALEMDETMILYARREGFVFLEIEGLLLLKSIQQRLKLSDLETTQKITQLLDTLAQHTQQPELRSSLEQYRQNVRAAC